MTNMEINIGITDYKKSKLKANLSDFNSSLEA